MNRPLSAFTLAAIVAAFPGTVSHESENTARLETPEAPLRQSAHMGAPIPVSRRKVEIIPGEMNSRHRKRAEQKGAVFAIEI